MNIEIQSVHFAADKQLRNFITKKVEKLTSIDDTIINADIYLKFDKPESFGNKIVEIKLRSSFCEYFAKKQANSFEESADLVSQALRKQILKHKEK
tara:strand:- start:66 stop:353 length:288 start_codon:yes stop_codon:yes gene_type:complete